MVVAVVAAPEYTQFRNSPPRLTALPMIAASGQDWRRSFLESFHKEDAGMPCPGAYSLLPHSLAAEKRRLSVEFSWSPT